MTSAGDALDGNGRLGADAELPANAELALAFSLPAALALPPPLPAPPPSDLGGFVFGFGWKRRSRKRSDQNGVCVFRN